MPTQEIGANRYVGAWVVKVLLVDPELGQHGKVAAIDPHHPNIVGGIRVLGPDFRIKAGFSFGDGCQKKWVDLIPRSHFFPACVRLTGQHHGDRYGTDVESPFHCLPEDGNVEGSAHGDTDNGRHDFLDRCNDRLDLAVMLVGKERERFKIVYTSLLSGQKCVSTAIFTQLEKNFACLKTLSGTGFHHAIEPGRGCFTLG